MTENNLKSIELVEKIASFLEREGNWSRLKACWLTSTCGIRRSDDLRKLLMEAICESDECMCHSKEKGNE